MKLKIGIVGYGNLGHAVEKEIYSSDKYKLIAIFSRRNVKRDCFDCAVLCFAIYSFS